MNFNDGKIIENPCDKCKNFEFCKYAMPSQEALSGLKIGDGNGPFSIIVSCRYRSSPSYGSLRGTVGHTNGN